MLLSQVFVKKGTKQTDEIIDANYNFRKLSRQRLMKMIIIIIIKIIINTKLMMTITTKISRNSEEDVERSRENAGEKVFSEKSLLTERQI